MKMPLIEAVRWENPGENELAARYPDVAIKYGSQLTVMENQWGVLFKDGKALDVFEPGRHTITSKNIPYLTSLIQRLGLIGDIFHCEVVFVNKSQSRINFGGRAYSAPSGQIMYQAELGYHGYMIVKVGNPKMFVTEFFGNRDATDTQDVTDFIRGFAVQKIMTACGEKDIFSIVRSFSSISQEILAPINQDAESIGLRILNSLFEGVDIPENARRFATTMGREAMSMQYTKETAEVLPENGGTAGAAMGAGLGFSIGQNMINRQGEVKQQIVCPSCGKANPFGNNFCSNCSASLKVNDSILCPSCGVKNPRENRYCGQCGEILKTETKCLKCGQVNSTGNKYCSECGEKLQY